MSARAISAQLVDIRNVGAHKCVKLTIHVPEEQALHVTQLFGWPTGAAPVSVALARLEVPAPSPKRVSSDSSGEREPVSDPGLPAERGHKSAAQVAGYLCTLPSFQKFLREKFSVQWNANWTQTQSNESIAAGCIYNICAVSSRRDLTDKNTEWHALQLAFRLWQNHPELEDA